MTEKVCKNCKYCTVIDSETGAGNCSNSLNSGMFFIHTRISSCGYWEEKSNVEPDSVCSGYKYLKIKVTSDSGATCKVPEINPVNTHVGYCSACHRAYGLNGSSEEYNYKYCPYCGDKLEELCKP